MRIALLLLFFVFAGCAGEENTKTETIATTAGSKVVVDQVPQKTTPKIDQVVVDAGAAQRANEKREKREALTKLVEDRKAEFLKAKLRAETATTLAAQAREDAEKAAVTAGQDYRVYLRAKQLSRGDPANLPDGIRYDKSKQAASETLQRAKQTEAEKVSALEAKGEFQAALHRAEELLAAQGGE